jgi:phosphoribosylglycinamide formyltransferase 1
MKSKIRIGALISGGGSNLQAIIDACEAGRIDGSVVFVGTDYPTAGGLKRALKHDIPSWVVDYTAIMANGMQAEKGPDLPPDADIKALSAKQGLEKKDAKQFKKRLSARVVAEAALLEKMRQMPFDLLVLAGFMRLLTPYFIDKVNGGADLPRIMNIHPALLPAFPGTDGYGDTFSYGCKVAGCTVHFIDYGEDTGPIIGQRAFAVAPGDTFESVKKKGLEQEWLLYPECVQLYAQNRLRLEKRAKCGHGAGPKNQTVVVIDP